MSLKSIQHGQAPSARHTGPPPRTDALTASHVTRLDLALLGMLALHLACGALAARLAAGWATAAVEDAILLAYLLALLVRPAWRPLLARLFLFGLVAGVLELATDAAGERFAHSLVYPPREPLLWASPAYMPLSWALVLTELGYLAWRLRTLVPAPPLGPAMAITGLWAGLNIPLYEELAYHAGWWHYTNTLHIGHTPIYVPLFEGLIGAALPLLVGNLPRLAPRAVLARGIALGAWMPCAALLAWLPLGR